MNVSFRSFLSFSCLVKKISRSITPENIKEKLNFAVQETVNQYTEEHENTFSRNTKSESYVSLKSAPEEYNQLHVTPLYDILNKPICIT